MDGKELCQETVRGGTSDDLDWDDHRHEPSSLPRAGPHPLGLARSRAPTAATIGTGNPLKEFAEFAGPLTRDGPVPEYAIEDEHAGRLDENSEQVLLTSDQIGPTRNVFLVLSPARGRDQALERPSRRSSTPSVRRSDNPRAQQKHRRRFNTANSKAPSEHNLSLHRTASNGTRRRPTLTEVDLDSIRVEEDVCYPAPVENERPGEGPINYAAIIKFITEQARSSPETDSESLRPLEAVKSHVSQQSLEISHDLRSQSNGHTLDYSAETPIDVPCYCDEKLAGVAIVNGDTATHGKGGQKEGDDQDTRPEKSGKARFSFLSSRLDDPIEGHCLGDLASSEEGFRQLFDVPQEPGAHWWLDVYNASVVEIDIIAAAFYLHPLTEEDIKQQEEREKAELFKNYYFVTFRSFQIDKKREDYMEAVQYYMVVLRGIGILSFSFRPNPHREFVQSRLLKMRDVTFLGNDWINYALIDHIVDVYKPAIKGVEDHSDELEDNLFTARQEDLRSIYQTLGECRQRVMRLIQLTGSKHDVLAALKKRCTKEFAVAPKHELGMYLGDVRDHVLTMMANLEHAEKMITRCQTTYQAQMTMAEIENNARLNKVLARITLIGTLLVPLNLIIGLFGMNVPVPGRETTSLSWFFGILGMLTLVVISFVGWFRYKRWL